MPLPLTLLTVKLVLVVSLLMVLLVKVQLPVLVVTQLSVPPGTKLPVTVAPATVKLLLRSRTVAVTCARQPVPALLDLPVRLLMATVFSTAGALLASENSKRLGEPVPADVTLFKVA